MSFFKSLLASIIGFFIALFLVFVTFIMIGVAVAGDESLSDKKKVELKPNSVLELDLSEPIKDYAPSSDNPLEKMLEIGDDKLALNKIILAIEKAKTDDNIKGISIKTTNVNAGIAQTQAIRDKIEEFKTSGKFVYAYNDFYMQKTYYLSSVADSLYVNPVGEVEFRGLLTDLLYFKDFEDKYGIKMEVIRHGKYKSAVEPFLENKMSEANREQTSSFLKSIWSEMTDDISKSRKLTVERLNAIADNSLSRTAELSKQNGLVDRLIYEDQYETKLKVLTSSEKLNLISIKDYISLGVRKVEDLLKENRIAVIYAQGSIIYGKGDENKIGQELINKAIRKAVEDKYVKAIVLRVNSPGGSALASELIWRELELAKKEKPLIVSMGNLAASGGYYISCGANKIFAEPTTITGSIGVFGMMPNAYEFSKNIGVNAEQVATNNSPSYSIFEPMDKRFYEVTKEGVETIYRTFVSRVSAGRHMTFEDVDEVAQGRVWTGKEALSKGLVDELGSLDDAIKYAAEFVKVEDYQVKNYPKYEKEFKDLFKSSPFMKVDKEELVKETIGEETYQIYKHLNELKTMKGIQAKMPFVFEIK